MEKRSYNKDRITKTGDFSQGATKLENSEIIYGEVKRSDEEAV